MPDDLPFVPDATLDLVDAGWWLELRCGACGRAAFLPRRLLAAAHGARAPELLPRMRCGNCGARPRSAAWMDNPAAAGPRTLYPPPRRVPLA